MPPPIQTEKVEVEQIGYVSELTVTAEIAAASSGILEFIKVAITTNIEGSLDPVFFYMDRAHTPASDIEGDGRIELTYGSAEITIAAFLKDAYLHRKRVIAKGYGYKLKGGPPPKRLTLSSVCLSERSGPYILTGPLGPVPRAKAKAGRASRKR